METESETAISRRRVAKLSSVVAVSATLGAGTTVLATTNQEQEDAESVGWWPAGVEKADVIDSVWVVDENAGDANAYAKIRVEFTSGSEVRHVVWQYPIVDGQDGPHVVEVRENTAEWLIYPPSGTHLAVTAVGTDGKPIQKIEVSLDEKL